MINNKSNFLHLVQFRLIFKEEDNNKLQSRNGNYNNHRNRFFFLINKRSSNCNSIANEYYNIESSGSSLKWEYPIILESRLSDCCRSHLKRHIYKQEQNRN